MGHATASRTACTEEYRVRYAGKTFTLLMTMATVFGHESKPRGVVVVGADVTRHNALEKKLFSSRERLHLAYRATRDGFWDWDEDTGESYLSSKLVQLLRFDQGDFPLSDTK
jgi:PAS domain-containing protein